MQKINFSELAKNWPAPFVTRDQRTLDKFSGGILKASTLANNDSLGTGPAGKIKISGRVAYPTESLIQWLESRCASTRSGGNN